MFLQDQLPRLALRSPRPRVALRYPVRRVRLGQAPMPTVEDLGAVYAAATGLTLTAFWANGPIGAPTTAYTVYWMAGDSSGATQTANLDATQMAPYITQWQAARGVAPAPPVATPVALQLVVGSGGSIQLVQGTPPLTAAPPFFGVEPSTYTPVAVAPTTGAAVATSAAAAPMAAPASYVTVAEFNAYVQAALAQRPAAAATTPTYYAAQPGAPTVTPVAQQAGTMSVLLQPATTPPAAALLAYDATTGQYYNPATNQYVNPATGQYTGLYYTPAASWLPSFLQAAPGAAWYQQPLVWVGGGVVLLFMLTRR